MKNIKSNKGITNATVLITVLIIIVLMLLVAVIYLVKNPNTTYITQNTPTEQQTVNSSNVEEEKLTTSTEIKTKKVEMTSDEKYKVYVDGLKESINKLKNLGTSPDGEKYDSEILVNSQNYFTSEKQGIVGISLDYTGTAYLESNSDSTIGKKYGEKYKLKSNTIKVGITEYGHDSSLLIWSIDEKGKISYIQINQFDNDIKIELKEYDSLKNIIDIEVIYNGESIIPVAIDIDGKIHEINV